MSVITTSIVDNNSKNVNIQSTITTDNYKFNQPSQTINTAFNKSSYTSFDDMLYGAKSISADKIHFEVPSSKERGGSQNVKINNCNALYEPFHSFDLVRVHLLIPNCSVNYNSSRYVSSNTAHNYGLGLRDTQNGITSIKMIGWFNLFIHDKSSGSINIDNIKVQIGTNKTQSVKYLYGSGTVGDPLYHAVSVGGVSGRTLEWFNGDMSSYTIKFQIMQIVI